jgi:hypothetical protein
MSTNNKKYDKVYQKEYYQKNRKTILAKLSAIETCEFCNRKVNHQNIYKHQSTKLCLSHRKNDSEAKTQDVAQLINKLESMIIVLKQQPETGTN